MRRKIPPLTEDQLFLLNTIGQVTIIEAPGEGKEIILHKDWTYEIAHLN